MPETTRAPLASWGVGLAFFLLYATGAATTVQGGDAGEFLLVAARGGVAHPPGYPLYTLLGRLALAIPFGTTVWKVSCVSALLGALALAVLHRAVLRLTRDPFAAGVAAVAMGTSVLMWKWSGVAEVLSGAVLTTSLLLLVAVRSATGARGPKQATLLGLAFATGIANHHTAILLAPLVAFAGIAALPRPLELRTATKTTLAFVAACLAGLLPYLLLTTDGGAWRWGDTTRFDGLLHHFLRRDYGTFTASERTEGEGLLAQPLMLLRGVPRQFPGLLALLIPVGVWHLLRRRDPDRPVRVFTIALLLSWFLAGPLFAARFDLPTSGYTRVVIERFHSVPNLLLAALLGVGAGAVVRSPRWSRPALPAALLVGNLLVFAPLAMLKARWTDWTVLEDYLGNVEAAVEPDALVLTSGDSMFFGGLYLQGAEGRLAEVAWVNPGLRPYPWYREALKDRFPRIPQADADGSPLPTAAWVAAASAVRPVYVAPRLLIVKPELRRTLPPVHPHRGVLLRVLPEGAPLPPPDFLEADALRARKHQVFRSVLIDEDRDHELETPVWENYALTWLAVEQGFLAAGDVLSAARARSRAREFAPWLTDED